jgi:hypothetical protein
MAPPTAPLEAAGAWGCALIDEGPRSEPRPANTIRLTVMAPVVIATAELCTEMPLESDAVTQPTWKPVPLTKLKVTVASFGFSVEQSINS